MKKAVFILLLSPLFVKAQDTTQGYNIACRMATSDIPNTAYVIIPKQAYVIGIDSLWIIIPNVQTTTPKRALVKILRWINPITNNQDFLKARNFNNITIQ